MSGSINNDSQGWYWQYVLYLITYQVSPQYCQGAESESEDCLKVKGDLDNLDNLVKKVKCINFSVPLSPELDISAIEEWNCSAVRLDQIWDDSIKIDCSKDCPKSVRSYAVNSNSIPCLNGRCHFGNCTAKVSLTFQSPYKTVKAIQWGKTTIELVSEIGGHLGLFVGASLITIVEIGEFVMCFGLQAVGWQKLVKTIRPSSWSKLFKDKRCIQAFKHSSISIRWCVHPSVRWSVGPSVTNFCFINEFHFLLYHPSTTSFPGRIVVPTGTCLV